MEIKRLLVILGISLIFIVFFCEDIVEGSEDQTMTDTTMTDTPMTDTPMISQSSENEIDKMIELQMLQMEVLKDIVKNKK